MKIINSKKKKIKLLTKEQQEVYENAKSVLFIKKNLKINIWRNNSNVKNHCHYTGKYRGAAHSICNLRYSVSRKIPIVFHKE